MAIGPVQPIALGFDKPDFQGEIVDELERLRGSDMVRVIDALVVYKDANGEVVALKGSQLSKDEAEEFGAVVGGLLGLGAAGEEGMVAGAMAGAEAASDGVDVFSEEEAWMSSRSYRTTPPLRSSCSSIDGRWAPDAVMRAGGFRIAESFISPLDLVEVGPSSPRRPKRSRLPKPGRNRPRSRSSKGGTLMMPGRRVARRTARRTSRRMASQMEPQAPPPAAVPPPAAAPAPQDEMAELQQLAQMKEQGILTEEEFAAKKKQILGIEQQRTRTLIPTG